MNLFYTTPHASLASLASPPLTKRWNEEKKLTRILKLISTAFVHAVKVGILNVMFWKPCFWINRNGDMVNFAAHGFVKL